MMLKKRNFRKYFIISIVLMLLSSISILIGAVFKIQHWPLGRELLLFGMVGEVVAVVLAGVGLSKFNKYRKSQV